MSLLKVQRKHLWETIWVVGSGRSLSFVDRTFFYSKTTIAVNHSAQIHGFIPTYVYSNYHSVMKEALHPTSLGVTLLRDTVTNELWDDAPDNVLFTDSMYREPAGPHWDPFEKPPAKDTLLYGSTSLHGAMHLAAVMGAYFIVLVGADCGWIDGRDRIDGYPLGENPPEAVLGIFEQHNRKVKAWLLAEYGVHVYSLNPFLNLNLEGHEFRGG